MTAPQRSPDTPKSYAEWYLTAKDRESGMLLITHMHRCCNGAPDAFHEADRIMRAAFEAGYKAGRLT